MKDSNIAPGDNAEDGFPITAALDALNEAEAGMAKAGLTESPEWDRMRGAMLGFVQVCSRALHEAQVESDAFGLPYVEDEDMPHAARFDLKFLNP